jgi:hypothetical protein
MDETKITKPDIPREMQEQAKNLIKDAFRVVGERSRQLADELSDFDKKYQENERRIRNGARRTSGRII